MTDRERFINCVLGRSVDRPPYLLYWGPWSRAWQRWQDEGKPEHVTDHRSFMQPDTPPLAVPVNIGPCPAFEHHIIEEDADYIVHTDQWGIVRRDYKHGESMSEFLKFPVAGWDDWRRFKSERLDPKNPARLGGNWLQACRDWTDRGLPIQLGHYPFCTVYGGVRWLLGDEESLIAFYDAPDLVRDIMTHLTDLFLAVFGAVVAEGVRVDVVHIWEDMCGRQGPLISPAHWREFMGPCYRRVRQFMDENSIPVLSVDTDGKPEDIVPPMMESGVNFLWPMEVAAGCDVNDYRDRFPDLAMLGGIDKRALADCPAAIDAELDRVWPAVRKGRYIPDLDHLIPDDVSWPNYEHFCRALKQRVMDTGPVG